MGRKLDTVSNPECYQAGVSLGSANAPCATVDNWDLTFLRVDLSLCKVSLLCGH